MSQLSDLSGLSAILTEAETQHLLNDVEIKPILDNLYQMPDPIFGHNETQEDLNQLAINAYNNHVPEVPIKFSPSVLSNEEYAGPFNFEVFISPTSKNPWVYSPPLKKIFIAMNSPFPVDFKTLPADIPMYVRATPLFSLPQHSQELVVRCIPHAQKTDSTNINMPSHIWDHVIRCQNPLALYEGDKDTNQHLSVVVPLDRPQTGMDTVREMYQFVCKNSCPSGMNRKPLEVVFTLENKAKEIFGRSILRVRVCSCPKRDKEKEEKESQKKGAPEVPHGKKRKIVDRPPPEKKLITSTDMKVYNINISVVGKQSFLDILKSSSTIIAAQMYRQGQEQPFKKYLDEIDSIIKNHTD